MNCNSKDCAMCTEKSVTDTAIQKEEQTVGQYLDVQIKQARQRLEDLVIRKAKLDTAGITQFPVDVVGAIFFG